MQDARSSRPCGNRTGIAARASAGCGARGRCRRTSGSCARDRGRAPATRHVGLVAPSVRAISRLRMRAADIGDDRLDLRGAVGRGAVVDIDPDRAVIFADAVDAAGDMEFGAERDLEKAVDDFGVGEILALGRAALGDLGELPRLGGAVQARRPAESAGRPRLACAAWWRSDCEGPTEAVERHGCRALMPPRAGASWRLIPGRAMPAGMLPPD